MFTAIEYIRFQHEKSLQESEQFFSTTKENILKILILVTLSSDYFEKSFLVIR